MPETDPAHAAFAAETATQRLERLAHCCTDGRRAAAELELHDWHRHDDCPAAARVLLASILASRGRTDDARRVLHRHADTSTAAHDTQIIQALICVLVTMDLTDAARRLVDRLHHDHGDDTTVAAWLRVMQAPGLADINAHADAQVERLCVELLQRPHLLPTLVAAQKLAPVAHEASLLRQAVARMARDAQDDRETMLQICHAMADLSLLLSDDDEARRWAHRGLRINPFAAPLALVLAQVADDPALGVAATDVLRTALDANPSYADLRAALIRRNAADGKPAEARLQLQAWLRHDPDHPVAHRLQSELAA